MAETQEDQQLDVKPADTLTLGVRDQNGEIIHFKIKKTTKFEKIVNAYAQRKGMASSAFRFMLDGKRVGPTESPASLDLGDGDNVDVVFEQTGGF